jgi:hypothetical protein
MENALVLVNGALGNQGIFLADCPGILQFESAIYIYRITFNGSNQYSICRTNKITNLTYGVGQQLTFGDVVETMEELGF